jgi:glycosyltransferase involved in cell wall biosynthesis
MTTYNGEVYLEEQLRSLAEQAHLPDELVICDDTSTDSTVDIINRFSEGAPFPVRLFINEERLGWRCNFLSAASLCRSEYIAFCDQDDIWLSDKLATAASHLNKTPMHASPARIPLDRRQWQRRVRRHEPQRGGPQRAVAT